MNIAATPAPPSRGGARPDIAAGVADFVALRREFHADPELAFHEHRTAARIATLLSGWGYHVERLTETGVIATLTTGPGPVLGIRADIDALPITETADLPFASRTPGRMHACGHDGHSAILLAAARHLARARSFRGTLRLIFQPAEEIGAGARALIDAGLFQHHPVDAIFGLHNWPGLAAGQFGFVEGAAMAAVDKIEARILGQGGHGAEPHLTIDPVVAAAHVVTALQTVVSRNVDPVDPCVLSCTQFHTGSAYNIVPETATITGTVRYFDQQVMDLVATRMRELCAGLALAHGIGIDIDIRNVFDVLVNEPDLSDAYLAAAADVLGQDNVSDDSPQFMGSEDFADMSATVPGAYINVLHGGQAALHNPAFVLDPEILPIGSSIYARIIERRMPLNKEAA